MGLSRLEGTKGLRPNRTACGPPGFKVLGRLIEAIGYDPFFNPLLFRQLLQCLSHSFQEGIHMVVLKEDAPAPVKV